ncbi:hypothetical protein, partial [Escherichia coli]|uniref:hypothetical protein n=1 Tax=Escherichia coli TaxID=562 RepID=UPI00196667E3
IDRVPKGLFFHAARALFELHALHRRNVMSECRIAVATAFARLGPPRVLDRIALLLCVTQSAIYADAGDTVDTLRKAEVALSRAMMAEL